MFAIDQMENCNKIFLHPQSCEIFSKIIINIRIITDNLLLIKSIANHRKRYCRLS